MHRCSHVSVLYLVQLIAVCCRMHIDYLPTCLLLQSVMAADAHAWRHSLVVKHPVLCFNSLTRRACTMLAPASKVYSCLIDAGTWEHYCTPPAPSQQLTTLLLPTVSSCSMYPFSNLQLSAGWLCGRHVSTHVFDCCGGPPGATCPAWAHPFALLPCVLLHQLHVSVVCLMGRRVCLLWHCPQCHQLL